MKNIVKVDKEKLERLLAWGNMNKALVMNTNTNVFETGSIDIIGKNILHFKNNGNNTEFTFKHDNKFVISFNYKKKFFDERDVKNLKYNIQLEGQKAYIDNLKKEIIHMYNCLNAYVQHYQKKEVEGSRKKVLNENTKEKNINTERVNNIIKISNTVYEKNNNSDAEKRNYRRHIESWTTRGHWRTLKSGKRVWIKQYSKGKKNELVERIYTL